MFDSMLDSVFDLPARTSSGGGCCQSGLWARPGHRWPGSLPYRVRLQLCLPLRGRRVGDRTRRSGAPGARPMRRKGIASAGARTRPRRPPGRELVCRGVIRRDPSTATVHPRVSSPPRPRPSPPSPSPSEGRTSRPRARAGDMGGRAPAPPGQPPRRGLRIQPNKQRRGQRGTVKP